VLCAPSLFASANIAGGAEEFFVFSQSKNKGWHTRLFLVGIPEMMFVEGKYLNCPLMNMSGNTPGQQIEDSV
jgi:hypothetical protein